MLIICNLYPDIIYIVKIKIYSKYSLLSKSAKNFSQFISESSLVSSILIDKRCKFYIDKTIQKWHLK
jgi:hypothetical protein